MIENIFRIIKADRYTKDGCDEIQKAKDNLAEDEKYNIGDISKKTGLQKTANGWVEPKKAKAGAGKPKQDKVGNFMKAYERGDFGKYQQNAEQKKAENFFKQSKSKESKQKNVHGAEVDKIYERQLKRIKELKAKGFTDEQIDNDKIIKQTKEDMKNVGKKPVAENKPDNEKSLGQKNQEGQSYIEANARMTQAALEALNRGDISKEQFKQHVQAINNATRENLKKINGSSSKDAAPRELTGDCKIRIRK